MLGIVPNAEDSKVSKTDMIDLQQSGPVKFSVAFFFLNYNPSKGKNHFQLMHPVNKISP